MKGKRILAALLALVMVLSTTTVIFAKDWSEKQTFKDVGRRDWSHGYVENLADQDIVHGYGDGTYGPLDNLTRQQAAKMIAIAAGLDFKGKTAKFPDVPKDSEFSGYIAALVEKGAISGFTDGTFRPTALITRSQAAKMIAAAFGLAKGDFDVDFPDTKDLDPKDKALVDLLASLGIVKGYEDGKEFRPFNNVSRAQFAKMLAIAQATAAVQRAEADGATDADLAQAKKLVDNLPDNQDIGTKKSLEGRLDDLEEEEEEPGPGPVVVQVSAISVDVEELILKVGDTGTITATISPSNATNKNVAWTSDNEEVATVTDGVITAVATGTAIITVTSAADGTKTATTTVTVIPAIEGKLYQDESGVYFITNTDDLVLASTNYFEEGGEFIIANDIDMTDDSGYAAPTLSGVKFKLDGNDKTITGLDSMLIAHASQGVPSIVIEKLTLDKASIEYDVDDGMGNVGVGAFIGHLDGGTADVVIENCKLQDSTVNGGHWTGGFIGYAAGWDVQSNGPCFLDITIKNSTIINSVVTGKGSCGGVIGHATGNPWTKVTIDDCTVTGNTISSTGDSTVKAGSVMGTIGCAGLEVHGKTGGVYVNNLTTVGNTVTSNGVANDKIYGRQGNDSGRLYVDGVEIVFSADALVDAVAKAKTGVTTTIELANSVTVSELTIPSGKDIVITGSTESVTFDGQFFVTGKLTVEDMTITNENATTTGISKKANNAIYVQSEGEVICENVIFDLKKNSGIVSWWDSASTNTDARWTNIVVKDSIFNCNNHRPIQASGDLTVEGCTFNDQYRYSAQLTCGNPESEEVVINFKNNTINQASNSQTYSLQLTSDYGNSNMVINVEGNTINNKGEDDILYVWESGIGLSDGYVDMDTITINGGELVCIGGGDGYTKGSKDTYYVANAHGLAIVLNEMDVKIKLVCDFEAKNWNSANAAYKNITLDGNGHTITNLNAPLFSNAGVGAISVSNLTVKDAQINTDFAAVFVGEGQYNGGGSLSFSTCVIDNVTLKGNRYTGGFVAFSSSNEANDVTFTFNNCEVKNSQLTANGSVGAIIGHTYPNIVINNVVATDNNIECTEDRNNGAAKAGALVGTVNSGTTNIDGYTITGTEVKNLNAKTLDNNLIGRNFGEFTIK